MLTIATILCALSLLSIACPVDQAHSGVKISLIKRQNTGAGDIADPDVLKSHLEYAIGKYNRGLEAYLRNTGNEHSLVTEALSNLSRRTTHYMPLTEDHNGELWQGSITVGEPPQTFTVQFDTGSSDLILPGPACTKNCQGHKLYNPWGSSTAIKHHQSSALASYSDDESITQGEQYADTIVVAGLTAENQTLCAASAYSSHFAPPNFPSDGVLGMAYQAISQYDASPVFRTLINQSPTLSPVFAFKFSPSSPELLLGGIDHNSYVGALTYTPVTTQGFWQLNLDMISVGGKTAAQDLPSILDTSVAFIIGDLDRVRTFYGSVEGSKDATHTVGEGFYTIPCASLPSIALTFGGKTFTLPPDSFSLGRVDGKPDSQHCIGAVVGSRQLSFWVVGNRFMQHVYTVFDMGSNRVGFAPMK